MFQENINWNLIAQNFLTSFSSLTEWNISGSLRECALFIVKQTFTALQEQQKGQVIASKWFSSLYTNK